MQLQALNQLGVVVEKYQVAMQPEYKANSRQAFFAALRENWAPSPVKVVDKPRPKESKEPQAELSFERPQELLAETKATISAA